MLLCPHTLIATSNTHLHRWTGGVALSTQSHSYIKQLISTDELAVLHCPHTLIATSNSSSPQMNWRCCCVNTDLIKPPLTGLWSTSPVMTGKRSTIDELDCGPATIDPSLWLGRDVTDGMTWLKMSHQRWARVSLRCVKPMTDSTLSLLMYTDKPVSEARLCQYGLQCAVLTGIRRLSSAL